MPDPARDGVGVEQESEEGYEVVIRPEDGYGKEHAELLRRRLIADGFYEDVVFVRKSPQEGVSE